MKIRLQAVDLHLTLLLGGKNFGQKIDCSKTTGVALVYDQEEKELWVTYNNKIAIIPSASVGPMFPYEEPVLAEPKLESAGPIPAQVAPRSKFKGASNAQVSTPTSHVFKTDGSAS